MVFTSLLNDCTHQYSHAIWGWNAGISVWNLTSDQASHDNTWSFCLPVSTDLEITLEFLYLGILTQINTCHNQIDQIKCCDCA